MIGSRSSRDGALDEAEDVVRYKLTGESRGRPSDLPSRGSHSQRDREPVPQRPRCGLLAGGANIKTLRRPSLITYALPKRLFLHYLRYDDRPDDRRYDDRRDDRHEDRQDRRYDDRPDDRRYDDRDRYDDRRREEERR